MGRLSATQLIDVALDVVGNTKIATQALVWLNLLLDETARSYRFPELQTRHTATVAGGSDTVAYPSDYAFLVKDRVSGNEGTFLESGAANSVPIRLSSLGDTRDRSDHVSTSAATPSLVADDRVNSQWIIHPIPSLGGTLYLNYQKNPVAITAAQTPWYPSDNALIEALSFLAERRQRGGNMQINAALKEAAKRLALSAPSRAILWSGGAGSGLDPSVFKR